MQFHTSSLGASRGGLGFCASLLVKPVGGGKVAGGEIRFERPRQRFGECVQKGVKKAQSSLRDFCFYAIRIPARFEKTHSNRAGLFSGVPAGLRSGMRFLGLVLDPADVGERGANVFAGAQAKAYATG